MCGEGDCCCSGGTCTPADDKQTDDNQTEETNGEETE